MSALNFNNATIDRNNPTKSEGEDNTWDVIYPLIIDPAGLDFPDELSEIIDDEWQKYVGRGSNPVCQATVVGKQVCFNLPKDKIHILEKSLDKMESLLAREIPRYKAKVKREGDSGDELDQLLNRLKK